MRVSVDSFEASKWTSSSNWKLVRASYCKNMRSIRSATASSPLLTTRKHYSLSSVALLMQDIALASQRWYEEAKSPNSLERVDNESGPEETIPG